MGRSKENKSWMKIDESWLEIKKKSQQALAKFMRVVKKMGSKGCITISSRTTDKNLAESVSVVPAYSSRVFSGYWGFHRDAGTGGAAGAAASLAFC